MDNLSNFIKYCLEYVKLTRGSASLAQERYSINLDSGIFELSGLLNGDSDGEIGELVNLKTFYKYDPNDVPEEEKDIYENEKELANKIVDIYNKYRNDPFTKQIILSFGYFEIEIPTETNNEIIASNDQEDENKETVKTKIRYPLFSLPVKIEQEFNKKTGAGEFYIYFVDPEVQVNIGMLESTLGEDSYFQLLDEIGKYEKKGQLSLPISDFRDF
jgi:hypothetical protein